MTAPSVEIRACDGLEELEMCVQLQLAVWGCSDSDVVPRKVFLVAQKIGGQVFGAFLARDEAAGAGDAGAGSLASTGNLVGFAMSLPGYRNRQAYLHSHMLAVLPGYRDSGIGRTLKLAQREDAIARGIELIEWTFDPLEIKNARLNIEKLGAIARRYTPNFYGASTSPLQGGLPTDRLHAEWWLRSSRAERALRESAPGEPSRAAAEARKPLGEGATIIVPRAMQQWKQSADQGAEAMEIQSRNRALFQQHFADGLSVLRFELDPEGNGIYHLGRWDEDLHL